MGALMDFLERILSIINRIRGAEASGYMVIGSLEGEETFSIPFQPHEVSAEISDRHSFSAACDLDYGDFVSAEIVTVEDTRRPYGIKLSWRVNGIRTIHWSAKK